MCWRKGHDDELSTNHLPAEWFGNGSQICLLFHMVKQAQILVGGPWWAESGLPFTGPLSLFIVCCNSFSTNTHTGSHTHDSYTLHTCEPYLINISTSVHIKLIPSENSVEFTVWVNFHQSSMDRIISTFLLKSVFQLVHFIPCLHAYM